MGCTQDPYVQMGCPPEPTRFAPMNWCTSAIPTPVPSYVSQAYFMGFNEPNNDSQCNISPAAAAKAWSEVMRLHPNSQLVSPATAGNGIAWFEAFFGNCTSLYGSKGCNIAYLAAHDYSCEPSHTMTYLQQLHDHFGYKVRGGTPHPSTVRPPNSQPRVCSLPLVTVHPQHIRSGSPSSRAETITSTALPATMSATCAQSCPCWTAQTLCIGTLGCLLGIPAGAGGWWRL